MIQKYQSGKKCPKCGHELVYQNWGNSDLEIDCPHCYWSKMMTKKELDKYEDYKQPN